MVVAKRKRFSTAEIKQNIAVNVLYEVALCTSGIGESEDVVCVLVCVHISS